MVGRTIPGGRFVGIKVHDKAGKKRRGRTVPPTAATEGVAADVALVAVAAFFLAGGRGVPAFSAGGGSFSKANAIGGKSSSSSSGASSNCPSTTGGRGLRAGTTNGSCCSEWRTHPTQLSRFICLIVSLAVSGAFTALRWWNASKIVCLVSIQLQRGVFQNCDRKALSRWGLLRHTSCSWESSWESSVRHPLRRKRSQR